MLLGAALWFLSLEPLLGSLEDLALEQIDWVIVGGESDPGAREVKPDRVRSIRDQCEIARVAFHFKRWGGICEKKNGRVLDGRTWDQFPMSHRSKFTTADKPRQSRR